MSMKYSINEKYKMALFTKSPTVKWLYFSLNRH